MKKALLWSLLWLCGIGSALAQDRRVTGKVSASDDNSPLPGVSVLLKGSNTGASTDASGSYSIAVPAAGGTLVFSSVGFATQNVEIGSKTVVNVTLATDARQLSEVVVTGVGVATSKTKLGIAVESILSRDLPPAPSSSIDQALQGKIAGALITTPNGTPGARANILLRGINTINRGTSPIILMDGVQVGATDINSIDLTNIERVEVIQGAAAGTIYGAQGANGVIQLFTKRGTNGPVRVNFSNSYATNEYLNIGNVHKADKHAFVTDANNVVIDAAGKPLVFDEAQGLYPQAIQYNALDVNSNANKPYDQNLKFYDHFKMFFIPSHTINNSLNISGGSDKFDFSFSGANKNETSTLKNNGGYNRTNLVANIGVTLAKNLTFRTITQLVYTKNTLRNDDRTALYSLNNTRPFANYDFVDADGNYAGYFGSAAGVNGFNPNYRSQYRNHLDNKVDVIQSFELDYKPIKFLALNAKYGMNYQRETDRYTYANQSQNRNVLANAGGTYVGINAPDPRGEISNYDYTTTYQNFLGSATIHTDFAKDFNSSLPIVTSTQIAFDYRQTKYREYNTYTTGLPIYKPFTGAQGANYRVSTDLSQPFTTYGYLINQRIEFGEFAGISGGFRSDYSSAFGGGSKPFTFPRGDIYLRPSSLGFWQNSALGNVIPEFKLRAAYGQAGIQPRPFDRYVTLSTRTLGNNSVFFYPTAQKNPGLDVEVSEELEIGTDFSLSAGNGEWFKRLNFSLTYWDRKTKNAIYDIDAAPSSGVGSLKDNAFSLGSNGLQFSLNTSVFKTQNFSWTFTTNFGHQTSKITAVKGGGEVVLLSSAGSTGYVLKAGEKIGQLFGFMAIRSLDQILPDGTPALTEAQKAAGTFEVASNGYVVNKTTKQPLFSTKQYSFGDPNPLFNASFINEFNFRNWLTVGFQFDWVYKNHVYNQTKSWLYRDGISGDYTEPITIGGQTGAWTAFYRGVYQAGANNGTKDYFYEDASYVRLRNVQIGVDFAKLTKLPVLRQAQLLLSGRNLLTFTKYTGFDPEVSSGSTTGNENSAWDRGTDHNTLPNLRSYQIGLNIGF